MSNFIVGLTGGIGSGKSTITSMFERLSVVVIDADVIAREVVLPGSQALKDIQNHFGQQYIQKDGQLNRALLRTKIFSDLSDKLWLNELLHPIIRSQLIAQTTAATSPYCILVAPLLIENNLSSLVNKVLVVDVDEKTQVERTLLRDTSSLEEVKAIIASQTTREYRIKTADDVINNNSNDLKVLFDKVQELNKKYLTLIDKK
jgi:dephospho-CoA kinase